MILSELRKTEHLSASSIGTYVECSLSYKFSKIDKIPMEFKNQALEFGTAIHKTLEIYYQEKLIGEKLLLKDVHDPEFMNLSIPDGAKSFDIDGDKFTPGISISNSEVGLASLSISAFVLRLICTNGLISKTQESSSYRHVSTKILEKFPDVLEKVSLELGNKKAQFKLSMDSPVDNPEGTIMSFNRQFQLNKIEQEAVDWGYYQDVGETMFHVINAYTKASQYQGLNAESSYKLQKTGGNILAMVN